MSAEGLSGGGPVLVRYRNRASGAAEIEFIRTTIAAGNFSGRVELSRLICRAWDWRQRNGALSEYACRDLLLRLEEWGHIELPVGRQRGGRARGVSEANKPRRRPIPELPQPVELIPIAEISIGDAQADLNTLVVRPIAAEERLGWRVYMERYHYQLVLAHVCDEDRAKEQQALLVRDGHGDIGTIAVQPSRRRHRWPAPERKRYVASCATIPSFETAIGRSGGWL